MDRRKKTVN